MKRNAPDFDRNAGTDANAAWLVTLGSITVSLLVVPAGVTYLFLVHGAPAGNGPGTVVIGLVALLPGLLMGATALWVAARG